MEKMDYEKMYKDALERARKFRDEENFTEMEDVFPELRESADEQIRRAIVLGVRRCADAGSIFGTIINDEGVNYSEVLAWLEKQKEHFRDSAKMVERESMDGKALLHIADKSYEIGYRDGKMDAQKEQKPVHTAKEMWEKMRLEVYAQASGNRHEPNCSDDSTKMFSLCDIDEIFEKIGNATVEPWPAEWSKATINGEPISTENQSVDISLPKWSEDIIRKAVKEVGLTQHQIDWFKTNVFPPKQKWSEEDEDKLNDILEMIKYADVLPPYDVPSCKGHLRPSNEYKETLSSWLKSLRPQPHWKPSKEQMEALESAVKLYKETHFEMYHERIVSLYEELKKLM